MAFTDEVLEAIFDAEADGPAEEKAPGGYPGFDAEEAL
jgi:hypothetical protein